MPSSPDQTPPALDEDAAVFTCGGRQLLGILHHGESASKLGILIVTGGPQYRIGSHRQFLLLARAFAAAGVPAFRFDHRGSGDSEGPFLGFEQIDDDIAAAVDAFIERAPGLQRIVLWGICDAASAILFYAHRDPRIAGLVLVNPWVREEEGEARAMVKHYYSQRLLDLAFWRKLISGEVALLASVREFGGSLTGWLRTATRSRSRQSQDAALSLPDRMAEGLAAFQGPVGLIISGRDLTAREFENAASEPNWQRLLGEARVARHDLPTADHTFSRRVWREAVADWTIAWLKEIGQEGKTER